MTWSCTLAATLAREHALKPLVSARSQAGRPPWPQPGLSARRSGEISRFPQAPLQRAGGQTTGSLPPRRCFQACCPSPGAKEEAPVCGLLKHPGPSRQGQLVAASDTLAVPLWLCPTSIPHYVCIIEFHYRLISLTISSWVHCVFIRVFSISQLLDFFRVMFCEFLS